MLYTNHLIMQCTFFIIKYIVKKLSCIYIVAPDVLHRHVKSISDSAAKNLHFLAPEIDAGIYM
jgi:hypothetical protein